MVQAAVKDNPLRALFPLLDALMAGNKSTPPSGDGHVEKCKATVPVCQPPTTTLSTALSTTPSTSTTRTSTISEQEPSTLEEGVKLFPLRINLPSGGKKYKCSGCGETCASANVVWSHIVLSIQIITLGPAPFARYSQAQTPIAIHNMSITATNFFLDYF